MLMIVPAAQFGGVQTWAARVLNALSRRGLPVGLVAEGERTAWPIDRAVEFTHIGPVHYSKDGTDCVLTDRTTDLSVPLRAASDSFDRLAARTDGPIVLAPQFLGAAYGLAAELTRLRPERSRLVGWAHSDNTYDAHIIQRYALAMHTAVGVSTHLAGVLAERLPREIRVEHIPYGVAVPPAPPRTPPAGRPLRLIYAGRLEDRQKRASTLPEISRALTDRNIDHSLTVVGGGPLAGVIAENATPSMRTIGPRDPAAVAEMLRQADGFLLPSRFEGLSIAMLEAMAAGCVPIVTNVRSGAQDAINHDDNGLLIDAPDDAPPAEIGGRFADAIARLTPQRWGAMSHAAHATASARFSIEAHTDRVAALLDRVAEQPPRPWPADRPAAYAELGGSVPADAADRVAAALRNLADRRVAIHGTGAHTEAVAPLLREADGSLVAFTDDDPARTNGELLGRPIVPPAELAGFGVTDVIISSALHERDIWQRRGIYESRGITVHRLYADAA